MKRTGTRAKRRSAKSTSFNPTSEDLQQATQAFLSDGGKIQKIQDLEEGFEEFLSHANGRQGVDEYLIGS